MKKVTGFTLIELLVVVGIVSSVFLFGVVAYRDFSRRQQLSETARQVRQDLLLAQQRALSGEKSVCQNPQTNSLVGYMVVFSSTSYQVVADCFTGQDPLVKDVKLGGLVSKTGGSSSVTFKILAQGTTDVGDQSIVLTHSLTSKTATVTISKTGSVSISF